MCFINSSLIYQFLYHNLILFIQFYLLYFQYPTNLKVIFYQFPIQAIVFILICFKLFVIIK